MTRVALCSVVVGIATLLLAPIPALAVEPPATFATVPAETPISAGEGWLVWSAPVPGGWGLDAYHEYALRTLPVKPRPQPFDLSVGTDAHGAAVVTFSRCTRTPAMFGTALGASAGGTLLEARSGAGCRVHVLELATGRESAVPIPAARGDSDTTPAMWHGIVAFGRRAPAHGNVWQVMLYSPRRPHSVRTLHHGAVPTRCPGGCAGNPIYGEVQALALDQQAVAFVWALEAPGVFGERTWEQRVDDLSDGRSGPAGTPILTESCTGPRPVEEEWPGPPFLRGRAAFFSTLERGECYKRFGSALVELNGGALDLATTGVPVLAMAGEGALLYGLVAPVPLQETEPSCPCLLQTLQAPVLAPAHYRPRLPFESG